MKPNARLVMRPRRIQRSEEGLLGRACLRDSRGPGAQAPRRDSMPQTTMSVAFGVPETAEHRGDLAAVIRLVVHDVAHDDQNGAVFASPLGSSSEGPREARGSYVGRTARAFLRGEEDAHGVSSLGSSATSEGASRPRRRNARPTRPSPRDVDERGPQRRPASALLLLVVVLGDGAERLDDARVRPDVERIEGGEVVRRELIAPRPPRSCSRASRGGRSRARRRRRASATGPS